jgi:hypothetical protein
MMVLELGQKMEMALSLPSEVPEKKSAVELIRLARSLEGRQVVHLVQPIEILPALATKRIRRQRAKTRRWRI